MLSKIKAVIFDMDGVIFDSEQIYYDACLIAAKRNNLQFTPEFVKQFAGKTSVTCQIILQSHLQDNELVEKLWQDWGKARQEILINRGIPLKTGIVELFQHLQKTDLAMALVTSADRDTVIDNFTRTNDQLMQLFHHIITVDDVTKPKPHPEPYLMATELLGHHPQDCIVIEDSMTGVSAALEAGTNTIMINEADIDHTHFNKPLLYKADSHLEVIDFLQKNGALN